MSWRGGARQPKKGAAGPGAAEPQLNGDMTGLERPFGEEMATNRRSRAERDNSRSEPEGCLRRQTFKRHKRGEAGQRKKGNRKGAEKNERVAEGCASRPIEAKREIQFERRTQSGVPKALCKPLRALCALCGHPKARRQNSRTKTRNWHTAVQEIGDKTEGTTGF